MYNQTILSQEEVTSNAFLDIEQKYKENKSEYSSNKENFNATLNEKSYLWKEARVDFKLFFNDSNEIESTKHCEGIFFYTEAIVEPNFFLDVVEVSAETNKEIHIFEDPKNNEINNSFQEIQEINHEFSNDHEENDQESNVLDQTIYIDRIPYKEFPQAGIKDDLENEYKELKLEVIDQHAFELFQNEDSGYEESKSIKNKTSINESINPSHIDQPKSIKTDKNIGRLYLNKMSSFELTNKNQSIIINAIECFDESLPTNIDNNSKLNAKKNIFIQNEIFNYIVKQRDYRFKLKGFISNYIDYLFLRLNDDLKAPWISLEKPKFKNNSERIFTKIYLGKLKAKLNKRGIYKLKLNNLTSKNNFQRDCIHSIKHYILEKKTKIDTQINSNHQSDLNIQGDLEYSTILTYFDKTISLNITCPKINKNTMEELRNQHGKQIERIILEILLKDDKTIHNPLKLLEKSFKIEFSKNIDENFIKDLCVQYLFPGYKNIQILADI